MSKDAIKRVAALGAVAALAAAPAAFGAQPADPGSNGNGHDNQSADHGNSADAPGHNKDSDTTTTPGNSADHSNAGGQAVVTYVFKGTYAGDGSVDVNRGNAHVRKNDMVDTTVAFDLSESSIVVRDNNDDGVSDLADVATGDKVVVKARLPRKAPGDQPFAAAQLIDQTQHALAPEVEPTS